MSRKIKQYKFEGDGRYITVIDKSGSLVDSGEISYIGVQGIPGTKIGINNGKATNLTVGYTGVYEADFSSFSGAYVRSIYVPQNQVGTILLDLLYSGELDDSEYYPPTEPVVETPVSGEPQENNGGDGE